MYTVGRLGSYISRGVYTVSGPFHPFGGAVDIIVVEQQDGSFKSSPWYVRFGKFQGVLKTKERAVHINVNEVDANFHMYLDHKGEAYFLREVDVEEGDSVLSPSSGEKADGQSSGRRPLKSQSYNYDANQCKSVNQIDANNGKVVARTSSRRSRILGFVFGSKSMKEDVFRKEEENADVVRANSLERAEIAADLLEVKWSTNLGRPCKKDKADKGLQMNDGQSKVDPVQDDNMLNSLDHPMLLEGTGSPKYETEDSSQPSSWVQDAFVKETGVEMSCLITEYVIGRSSLSESELEYNEELYLETSRKSDILGATNADHDENVEGAISENVSPVSQIPDSARLEARLIKKLDKEEDFSEKDVGLPEGDFSKNKNGPDRPPSSVYYDTSESSEIRLDVVGEQANGTLFPCGECGEACAHPENLHKRTDLISEVNSQPETDLLAEKECLSIQGFVEDKNCCNFFNDANILESETAASNSMTNSNVTETYSQMVTVQPIDGAVEEVESHSIVSISSFGNSICQLQVEKNLREVDNRCKVLSYSVPVGDPQQISGDCGPTMAINISPFEVQEEEQLLFGDLDDFKCSEVQCMESVSLDHVEKVHLSLTPRSNESVNESFQSDYDSNSSPEQSIQGNLPNAVQGLRGKLEKTSSDVNISSSSNIVGDEIGRMAKSLPNASSHIDDLDAHDLYCSLGHSFDSNSHSSKWTLLRKDISRCIKSNVDNGHQLSQTQPTSEDAKISEDLKNAPANPAVVAGDLSKAIHAPGGSWRLWPFPFKRSRSMKATQPALNCTGNFDAENALERSSGMGKRDVPKPKANRKKIRAITPTSEQLASLNLKEGGNTVKFTFSTAMLGEQQVDARIYLWRWDTRIVISDVDGTITKSDVLGQFMPLVGVDWSQTGVAHLFSAIKENGYQLLFLSARAISQAYHTRQFLFNLKQDGKVLPDGPVVISPDGLFPSLFREVIRRAPHEFKISCLEDIRVLFPSDRNPFYAGFGNRDTDEISYLKVGIPKGKIFIINPKGEVVVNRRIDRKSYTSLHDLVNSMFPSMSSSEQEDFNSWNYWKLPPPSINI